MGVCNSSIVCCTLFCVHSSIAIILMGKRELVALHSLSSWCLVMVERLFLAVPRGCLQFVIVVFPDHTHLLFLKNCQILMPQILISLYLVSSLKITSSCIWCALQVTGILILIGSLGCFKEVKAMDMILGKCKFPNSFLPYFL